MIIFKILAGVFLYIFIMASITIAVSCGVSLGMKVWLNDKK